ncbi:cyclic GMP-AMP synthase-like receptor 2 [Crassostrea virginica]
MSENGPSSTQAYFWRGCDHLMGFREFIDISRSETHTWLEISNRDGMFEWKAIGSFGDGMLFHKDYFDRLVIFRNMCVLSDETVWNPSEENRMVLLAEFISPGYCMRRYIAGSVFSEDLYCLAEDSHAYISSSKFLDKCVNFSSGYSFSSAPAVVTGRKNNICAVPVLGWPPAAIDWIYRTRKRCWPEQETMEKVIREGCHCVPIGQNSSNTKNHEWQLSFSVAECTLVQSMDHGSFKLYQLLKILLYERLIVVEGCGRSLSSYVIKTLVFWMCENKLPNFVCAINIIESIKKCLTQLEDWIRHGFVPHYFIPERNLLEEMIKPLQRTKMLARLKTIKSNVYLELSNCPTLKVFNVKTVHSFCALGLTKSLEVAPDHLKMCCEFEFFENVGSGTFSSMGWSRASQVVKNLETAYAVDSLSDIQLNIVKQLYYRTVNALGKISYRVASNSNSNKKRHSMLRLSEAFLRIGCSTDVASGKLSLASLYFCLKRIRKCIIITDSTLRGITPFTVYYRNFRKVTNNESRRQQYKEVISSDDLPLSLKMKRACVADVEILRTSHLWPEVISMEIELHPPEVADFTVPALIYLYFLRFLCFEITDDIDLKMKTLSDLCVLSYDEEHNNGSLLSFNMIGICHQKVRNYTKAIEMFCKGAKAEKNFHWMNRQPNPALLRIGIVLNLAFKSKAHV